MTVYLSILVDILLAVGLLLIATAVSNLRKAISSLIQANQANAKSISMMSNQLMQPIPNESRTFPLRRKV